MNRTELVGKALKEAMLARQRGALPLNVPICPFDLATVTYSIDVRFEPRATLEGMYSQRPRAIVIGSQRPAGRQTFTCAHELGHHVFGHGTRVDEVRPEGSEPKDEPEEFIAQAFAGFLLMPPMAIHAALKLFDVNPTTATTAQVYSLASYFGVGFTTFIDHLTYSLRMMTLPQAADFKKIRLETIRTEFCSPDPSRPLLIAKRFGSHRAVDCEIGDIICTPSDSVHEGLCLIPLGRSGAGAFWEAVRRGTSRIESDNQSAFVRVRPKEFLGRAIFRHEPDLDDEQR